MINADDVFEYIVGTSRQKFEKDPLDEIIQQGGHSVATTQIKKFFGDMGHALGFFVSAKEYEGAEEGEWLYDMVWYRDNAGFLLSAGCCL